MATIDEIFDAMATEEEAAIEYFDINSDTRQITVPESERIFGVESDSVAERKHFRCPRYVGDDLDLAAMFLTVNFRNANGEEDSYLVDDVQTVGEFITFSWELWPKVTRYKGAVQFAVCADLPNRGGVKSPDWNTTLATGEVLEGLDPDRTNVEADTSDVVTQLRAEVVAQTAAVEATGAEQINAVEAAAAAATTAAQDQVAAKAAEALATIPDDYSAMAAKVNEFANAIKGRLSGAIVRADDVSPVEHFPVVRVRSKNLFTCLEAGKSVTMAGVTFTCNDDGSITLQGTATDNSNFSTGEVYLEGGIYGLCDFAEGVFPNDNQARVQVYSITTGLSIATRNDSESDFVAGLGSTLTAAWHQCRIRVEAGHTYDCKLYPTLFKDEQPTEYVPHVADLTAVKVRQTGKNLFKVVPNTINGVTLSQQGDYFVLNGTATASNNFVVLIGKLPPGEYTLSANNPSNNGLEWSLIDVFSSSPYCILSVKDNANNGRATGRLDADADYLCRIRIENGKTYNNFIIKPQLELGSVATEYEAHKAVTEFTPLEDGSVPGVTSLAPTMSLLTDTAGVTITAEYNRDTNQVVQKLIAAITAMGGTV